MFCPVIGHRACQLRLSMTVGLIPLQSQEIGSQVTSTLVFEERPSNRWVHCPRSRTDDTLMLTKSHAWFLGRFYTAASGLFTNALRDVGLPIRSIERCSEALVIDQIGSEMKPTKCMHCPVIALESALARKTTLSTLTDAITEVRTISRTHLSGLVRPAV